MASDQSGQAGGLVGQMERKLALARELFEVSLQELLLVDLAQLSPLLERKNDLIERMARVDREMREQAPGQESPPALAGLQQALSRLVETILENEKALEDRLSREQVRLKDELREMERQARLRRYLDTEKVRGKSINLRR